MENNPILYVHDSTTVTYYKNQVEYTRIVRRTVGLLPTAAGIKVSVASCFSTDAFSRKKGRIKVNGKLKSSNPINTSMYTSFHELESAIGDSVLDTSLPEESISPLEHCWNVAWRRHLSLSFSQPV